MATGDLYRKEYKSEVKIRGKGKKPKPEVKHKDTRFNATKTYSNVNVHPKSIKPAVSSVRSTGKYKVGASNTQSGISTIGGSDKRPMIRNPKTDSTASHVQSRGVGNVYGRDRLDSTRTKEHPTRTRARANSGFMGMVNKQRKR
jgi:hypothetical protein